MRLIFLLLILLSCMVQANATTTINFEDLTPDTSYAVGHSFQSNGIAISVDALSATYGGGDCSIRQYGYAWGSGNEVWTNNVLLHFGFSTLSQLSLLFGNYGGYTKVEVNGDTLQVYNILDLNGIQIGGVDAFVTQSAQSGNVHGTLSLSGIINSFAIGGQEFAFDNVTAVPEPSSMLSLLTFCCTMAGIGRGYRRCR